MTVAYISTESTSPGLMLSPIFISLFLFYVAIFSVYCCCKIGVYVICYLTVFCFYSTIV